MRLVRGIRAYARHDGQITRFGAAHTRPVRRVWSTQELASANGRSWWSSSRSAREPCDDRCRQLRTFGREFWMTAPSLKQPIQLPIALRADNKKAPQLRRLEPIGAGALHHYRLYLQVTEFIFTINPSVLVRGTLGALSTGCRAIFTTHSA